MSSDHGILDLLLRLSPSARDKLRTVLMRDDRDEIASELLRYGDSRGDGWPQAVTVSTSQRSPPGWAAPHVHGVVVPSAQETLDPVEDSVDVHPG